MIFTGNTVPFHITQPPTDNYVQMVSSTATMIKLMCSLNINIPDSMHIGWRYNKDSRKLDSRETGNTTTLVIENPQPSDSGVYQCAFHDVGFGGSGWILRRNIVFSITGMYVCM